MTISIFKVDKDHDHARLDVYLTNVLSGASSRTFVQKLIEYGHVRVNEISVKAHHKLMAGDDVCVEAPEEFLTPQHVKPEAIPLDIFYEDECIIVVNKPCFSHTIIPKMFA